jgi:hypothetical protein
MKIIKKVNALFGLMPTVKVIFICMVFLILLQTVLNATLNHPLILIFKPLIPFVCLILSYVAGAVVNRSSSIQTGLPIQRTWILRTFIISLLLMVMLENLFSLSPASHLSGSLLILAFCLSYQFSQTVVGSIFSIFLLLTVSAIIAIIQSFHFKFFSYWEIFLYNSIILAAIFLILIFVLRMNLIFIWLSAQIGLLFIALFPLLLAPKNLSEALIQYEILPNISIVKARVKHHIDIESMRILASDWRPNSANALYTKYLIDQESPDALNLDIICAVRENLVLIPSDSRWAGSEKGSFELKDHHPCFGTGIFYFDSQPIRILSDSTQILEEWKTRTLEKNPQAFDFISTLLSACALPCDRELYTAPRFIDIINKKIDKITYNKDTLDPEVLNQVLQLVKEDEIETLKSLDVTDKETYIMSLKKLIITDNVEIMKELNKKNHQSNVQARKLFNIRFGIQSYDRIILYWKKDFLQKFSYLWQNGWFAIEPLQQNLMLYDLLKTEESYKYFSELKSKFSLSSE